MKPKPASQHLHTRGLQTFAALSFFVFHGIAFLQLATFNFVDVLDGKISITGKAGGNLHVDCVQLIPVK